VVSHGFAGQGLGQWDRGSLPAVLLDFHHDYRRVDEMVAAHQRVENRAIEIELGVGWIYQYQIVALLGSNNLGDRRGEETLGVTAHERRL
jgi:hypothetical protein